MDIRVILLNPQEEGNVGAVARAMKNFGFEELYLVNPCELGGVARAFASHGEGVLESARSVPDLHSALEGCDYIVGTTGKRGGSNTPKRKAIPPGQLADILKNGRTAIIFGNEALGLPNRVLQKTDFVVRIPASPKYPILNLAQSVCVILYELSKGGFEKTVSEKPIPRVVRSQLDRYTDEIVKRVYEQPHQREHIKETLYRIYGKSILTEQEGGRIISFYRKILSGLADE